MLVFIGSSKEGLPVAQAIQRGLHSELIEAVLWTTLFEPAELTLEALDKKAGDFDYCRARAEW